LKANPCSRPNKMQMKLYTAVKALKNVPHNFYYSLFCMHSNVSIMRSTQFVLLGEHKCENYGYTPTIEIYKL
jgi:hypothetical protein